MTPLHARPSIAESKPGTPHVPSVALAFAILHHLGGAGAGSGVTAIARAIGASPSTCFNILKTLAGLKVVIFDPVAKTYTLGDGLLEVARAVLRRDDVIAASLPHMNALAARFDATVGLWRLVEARFTLVAKAESPAHTHIHMAIGHRQPVGAGAGGRCAVAWQDLSRADSDAVCRQIRWQSPPTTAEYWRQVRETRERGWALDENNMYQGVTSVAAPILDAHGVIRFYMSASVFSGRHDAMELAAMGNALRSATLETGESAYGATGL